MATAAQQRIIRMLINIGRRRHEPTNAILSALTTGSVESRFQNLAGGDADSQGWRQERAQYYSDPRNLRHSINRYYNEWEQDARGRGLSIGQQAQAVQQSAFPDRYQQRLPLARRLLHRYGRTGSLDHLGSGMPNLDSLNPVSTASSGGSVFDTLQRLNEAAGMSDPNTESNYALFKALEGDQSGPDIPNLLPAIMRKFGQGEGGSPTGQGGKLGKVIGHPLDRAGMHTKGWVINAVRRIAGIYGHPITLGTGTAHDQYTVNGNVSDHWGGEAIDLPAAGRALIHMGQAALIAAGMSPHKARNIEGGLFNINGWQIIFNTQEGGDHTDHLHVHPPRPRRR